jgi:hypothetical protein
MWWFVLAMVVVILLTAWSSDRKARRRGSRVRGDLRKSVLDGKRGAHGGEFGITDKSATRREGSR